MLPKYGTYELPEGRCEITRRDTPEFNEARQLLSNTIRLDCSSALYSNSAANMDVLVKALLTAFAKQNQDFIVYLPGGTVRSQLSLYRDGSIGGVRVVQPPTIEGLKNAGYVTWLPFSFALEAEYPAANAGFLYRDYTESISYSSPDREDWLLCLHGPHQKQQVRDNPFYMATQTGSATGYLARPSAAQPIWPNAWVNRDELPGKQSPKARGNGYIDFTVSWQWRFKSNRPLLGNPNAWPL
jgi:hypothetical protein